MHESDHYEIMEDIGNLAALHNGMGHPELAIPLFEDLLKSQSQTLGPEHSIALFTAGNLGCALIKRNDTPANVKRGADLVAVAAAGLAKNKGPSHPYTLHMKSVHDMISPHLAAQASKKKRAQKMLDDLLSSPQSPADLQRAYAAMEEIHPAMAAMEDKSVHAHIVNSLSADLNGTEVILLQFDESVTSYCRMSRTKAANEALPRRATASLKS